MLPRKTLLSSTLTRTRFGLLEVLKALFGRVLANGQTIRWATQKPVLARIFRTVKAVDLAVDVGCGGGTYAIELLAAKAKMTVALDLSHEHAWVTRERARRKGLTNLYVIVASAERLPIRKESADLVLCSEVLEHVSDDRTAAKELARMMRDGARLVCTVPHPPEPCPNPDHVREGYSEDELRSMLAATGFLVDTSQRCMFGLTRIVMRLCHAASAPLPVLFLCQLENWLCERGMAFQGPYDLIVSGKRNRVLCKSASAERSPDLS